eukprot:TRINITY_DN12450_c5_g1_i1.p1 TRINITY_DN12450_c5_g1~~TRINITY_DN12450_c5_g1_i1.p1  ORF type:complete len:691 (+),score=134.72 TRINITY_DN12450_c5_g1_i1:192-2075(+)
MQQLPAGVSEPPRMSPVVEPAAAPEPMSEDENEEVGHHEVIFKDLPTEEEKLQSEVLLKQIQFTVESEKKGEVRSKVLVRLEKLIRTWMAKLLRAKGYKNPDDHGGRLLTFGSYKLGVHFPGSDIDTLCIAPRDVDREDFFDSLVNIFLKHALVKELNPVRDAHVPVIKMNFFDIQIDLVFSALDLDKIPPSPPFNIGDDSSLRNLDDPSQRSINGTRVAEKLLRCVPSVDTFRLALRGVKLWAKNRGIYGNIFGFPGGVAWAILTANICQLYPSATPGGVVSHFFTHYRQAIKEDPNSPNQPIYLTKSLDVHNDIGKKSWDKKNHQFELLPVITPMPPYMNCCYNVGRSNLKILCQEFKRGESIIASNEGKGAAVDWRDLWAPTDFFLKYKIFLQIEVVAMDAPNFSSLSAFVESKLRHLVTCLETWYQYSELPDIAKTASLEIRLWPFLFKNSLPTERLHFTENSPSNGEYYAASTPTPPDEDHVEPCPVPENGITGYYFIGLDTCDPNVSEGNARQVVDFEGAVGQFYQQLLWSNKTDKMEVPNITLVKRRHVPDWVLSEYETQQLRKKEMKLALRQAASKKARRKSTQKPGSGLPHESSGSAEHSCEQLPHSDASPPETPMVA